MIMEIGEKGHKVTHTLLAVVHEKTATHDGTIPQFT